MTQDKLQNSDEAKTSRADLSDAHPVYWFNDGSIILRAQKRLFRVHHSFLSRLSPFFAKLKVGSSNDVVDLGSEVYATDFEVLLQHLYHDVPLSAASSIDRFASILRVTNSWSLNFPTVHFASKELFVSMFPRDLVLNYKPANILEALALANEYQLTPVRKALLYSIVAGNEFNFHGLDDLTTPIDPGAESEIDITPLRNVSEADAKSCTYLMTKLIDYFTPILFTPLTTPHIPCTDVFADTWSPLISQPAIENEGMTKPLETLEQMKNIDWARHGLCASCTSEKRKEWSEEQHMIWKMMDSWLNVE
ncbi:hypothetical protein AX15_001434 [Amanita polypyramis BW_CC]|nr:hypothetical protein AX15_001434 [Amanita polypyramis BW_CC]